MVRVPTPSKCMGRCPQGALTVPLSPERIVRDAFDVGKLGFKTAFGCCILIFGVCMKGMSE